MFIEHYKMIFFFRVLLNQLPLSLVQETKQRSLLYFYVCQEDRQESHPLGNQVRRTQVIAEALILKAVSIAPHTHLET